MKNNERGWWKCPDIIHEQYIHAPVQVCFDMARNVDVHTQTVSQTEERAVGGVTSGLMEEGDEVTWEAVHLGVRQRLTAKITKMEKYEFFVDEMVSGAFRSFTHTHKFRQKKEGTVMTDFFHYKSPLGILGVLADKLFLQRYMRNFIVSRAEELKKLAEKQRT